MHWAIRNTFEKTGQIVRGALFATLSLSLAANCIAEFPDDNTPDTFAALLLDRNSAAGQQVTGPAVLLTENGGSVNISEAGGIDSYTLVLNTEPTADVSIAIAADAQTLINGGSCAVASSACTVTFTSSNWSTVQTITVSAIDDANIEGGHTGTITHSATSPDSDYNGIAINSVVANITDNDTAGISIVESGGNSTVTEGGATDTYTIVLNTAPIADVVITVSADPNTQINGGSCGALSSSCTFTFTNANWNTTQTVTIAAFDDSVVEGAHSSSITHSATSTDGTYNGIGIPAVSVSITDNDSAGISVTESGGNTTATEGGAGDTYTLALTSQPTANVIITVNADSSTQVSGGSCGGTPSASCTFTFTNANWNTNQTVNVTAIDDAIAEGAHNGTITHSASSGDGNYNGLGIGNVTVSITDNDSAGISLTESGSTDVSEAGTTDSYTIVLTSQPTANVSISVNADANTQVSGGSCGGTPSNSCTFTFTNANWNSAQTVTVTAVNDSVAESAHSATITHSASSGDANYNAMAIGNVSVNITDNDTAGITLTESSGSTAISEAGTTDSYTLILNSQPIADVVITITGDADGNLSGGSCGGTPASSCVYTFTSANWNSAQTVTVHAVNDIIAEGSHTATLTHSVSSSDPDYNSYAIANVTATITDNDTAGVTVVQSDGSTFNVEGIGYDSQVMRLNTPPVANVTVTVTADAQTRVGGGSCGAPSNSCTFTFTTLNYNTPQPFVIFAINDAAAEGTHSGTISFSTSSVDALYNGLSVPSLTTTIQDSSVVFSENWEGGLSSVIWKSWGTPLPYIVVGGGAGGTDALDTNGDSSYESGVVTYQNFDITKPTMIEFKARSASDGFANWVNLWVQFSASTAAGFSGTTTQPAHRVAIRLWPETSKLYIRYLNSTGGTTQEAWNPGFDNVWITYRMVINSDRTVSFFRDGTLIHTTTTKVDGTATAQGLAIHGRSYSTNVTVIDDIIVRQ